MVIRTWSGSPILTPPPPSRLILLILEWEMEVGGGEDFVRNGNYGSGVKTIHLPKINLLYLNKTYFKNLSSIFGMVS